MSPDTRISPALKRSQALLDQRIDWEKRDRADMRVDLGPCRDLCARLGHPQRSFRSVHVAGTKGKGSVASLIARGLQGAGYSVGLYTSPHVEFITERVCCNGERISEDLLAAGIDAALSARDEAEADGTAARDASWFDLFTVAGFHALRAAQVGWAVVEVGLGGRLDSTNVIEAELAILTNIDLEHTAVLGSTRAAIAAEKAGILRAGQTLVCGLPDRGSEDDPGNVVAVRARELGVPIVHVEPLETIGASNIALAAAALTVLGKRGMTGSGNVPVSGVLLTPAAVAEAGLPGRMERRWGPDGVPVVFDGAHVASSLERVLGELSTSETPSGAPQVVLSLAKDKDHEAILKALRRHVDSLYCTTVQSGIHLDAARLTEMAREQGLEAKECRSSRDALHRASARAAAGGWVLVTGSLYLVGDLRGLTTATNPSSIERPC